MSSIPPRSTRSILPSAGRTDELAGALRSTVLRVARQLHEEREKRTAMEASVEAHKFQAEHFESTSVHLTKRVEELQLEATQLAPASALQQLQSEHAELLIAHKKTEEMLQESRADVGRERSALVNANAELERLTSDNTMSNRACADARAALEEARKVASDKEQQAFRLEQFLREKARELVALDEGRKAAQMAAQRSGVELEAQRSHAQRMSAHMAQLEAELEDKAKRLNALESVHMLEEVNAADDELMEEELHAKDTTRRRYSRSVRALRRRGRRRR